MATQVLARPVDVGYGHGAPTDAGEHVGGGGSGWVTLVRAANDIEAHLVTGRLTDAGVEATTVKDRSTSGAWLHGGSDPWAPVLVLVRKLQLDDARLVLAEVAFEGPAMSGGGALITASSKAWRRPATFWAIAIGLGLLFTALGLAQTAENMKRCGSVSCSNLSPALP